MGGFYFITRLIVFDDRQESRAIEQITLLLSSLRNIPPSFLKNLANFFTPFLALGIQLEPQSV